MLNRHGIDTSHTSRPPTEQFVLHSYFVVHPRLLPLRHLLSHSSLYFRSVLSLRPPPSSVPLLTPSPPRSRSQILGPSIPVLPILRAAVLTNHSPLRPLSPSFVLSPPVISRYVARLLLVPVVRGQSAPGRGGDYPEPWKQKLRWYDHRRTRRAVFPAPWSWRSGIAAGVAPPCRVAFPSRVAMSFIIIVFCRVCGHGQYRDAGVSV
ncbi:hypothetical protein C8J57DRAFT_1401327 [Mycena rebaudengoi]|nr:hypothetical protein C8J57DRAFT_1401327 [Mycena rebaudengoi]